MNTVNELATSPIRSISRQFTKLSQLNVKLKMYDLGQVKMTTGKDGGFYYYYYDSNDREKTKTRKTLIGIMRYASVILKTRETEHHD